MKRFLEINTESPFSIDNLPFGIFSTAGNGQPRIGVAIGDFVLDMQKWLRREHEYGSWIKSDDACYAALQEKTLKEFAALGQDLHAKLKHTLQSYMKVEMLSPGQGAAEDLMSDFVAINKAHMHMPLKIGDYTDFYSGLHHAVTCGTLFRGKENALQANYKHLPVAYHGRASSIVVSGTPIRRPRGQILDQQNSSSQKPIFSKCRKMDMELELAALICKKNDMGNPISVSEASKHIFGYVMMNDWSARDIQAWEYVPLGPFNGKNFGTTISPWVVLHCTMEPFLILNPFEDQHDLLPYLQQSGAAVPDLELEVKIKPSGSDTFYHLFSSSTKYLYFSFAQMIAHHTINGCPLEVGDLLGSGTISGPESNQTGSFLEASRNGSIAVEIDNGKFNRKWIEDGDEIEITGFATHGSGRVGFGPCRGSILPALDSD